MDDRLPIYNSRITKNYLEYIGKHYPEIDIDSILEYAEIAEYEVEDPACWFNQDQVDRFHEILVAKTGNPDISREAGRCASQSRAIGALKLHAWINEPGICLPADGKALCCNESRNYC